MAMSSVTVRVDEQDKQAASAIVAYYGLDLSSATRAFYKQIIRDRCIPVDFGYPVPTEESLNSIQEADEILRAGGTGQSFCSGKDLVNAILKSK